MSYNLWVRFKSNVQKPRHMDPKKIARIEHYFKLQIPAGKEAFSRSHGDFRWEMDLLNDPE